MRAPRIAKSRLRIGLLLAALGCIGGCARQSASDHTAPATDAGTSSPAADGTAVTVPATTTAAAAATAATVSTARNGARTHIVLSPDNVHIEYRVYGSGDPAVILVHG